MYEFICDRIVPGCTVREKGDTPEAVREKAIAHLHEHHDMSYLDKSLLERVDTVAITALRI